MNTTSIPPMKAGLRREMVARRDAIPQDERSRIAAALVDRLVSLPQYAAARTLLTTMAIGSEWNTRPLIDRARADGKAIVLPRITPPPRRLAIYTVQDMERDLKPGVWDIPEPDPERCKQVTIDDVDFAVVPALAIDLGGYRLGYGAGYFDRLLTGRKPSTFCVTALPASFVVESLPHEDHDQRIDMIVDERGALRTRRP